MKYKIVSVIVVTFLFFSGITVFAEESEESKTTNFLTTKETIKFNNINIKTENDYISIDLENTNYFTQTPGKPMLPVNIKTYYFDFGTKIIDVKCKALNENIKEINGIIKPASSLQAKNTISTSKTKIEEEKITDNSFYKTDVKYPDENFSYSVHSGIVNNENKVIVNVIQYPVKYNPQKNTIYQIDEFETEITYKEPVKKMDDEKKYDLVIIAPRRFSYRLKPLVEHKNKMGLNTTLKTTESIYREALTGKYISRGVDKAEKIKLFIHWAKENWDIDYVLLVGGKKQQSLRWHLPVRYSNVEDLDPWASYQEAYYLTDLYFADIYKGDGEFDNWDSNGNGVFAEWKQESTDPEDVIDLYPDVYIGRLACRNKIEVYRLVKKIINYETTTYNKSWFNNMVVVGGDTFPNSKNFYEGEEVTNLSATYMENIGFNVTRLWESDGSFNNSDDIAREINKGCGFLFLDGHGSPITWDTHRANSNYSTWVDDFLTSEIDLLENYDKLPICIVDACHNSQFDTGLTNMLTGILKNGFRDYFDWSPRNDCFGKLRWIPRTWSWKMTSVKDRGSIATIGNTGLGYGEPNGIGGSALFCDAFFAEYVNTYDKEKNLTIGRIYTQALELGILYFHITRNKLDRKCAEEFHLLGDPSLMIGGYPN